MVRETIASTDPEPVSVGCRGQVVARCSEETVEREFRCEAIADIDRPQPDQALADDILGFEFDTVDPRTFMLVPIGADGEMVTDLTAAEVAVDRARFGRRDVGVDDTEVDIEKILGIRALRCEGGRDVSGTGEEGRSGARLESFPV